MSQIATESPAAGTETADSAAADEAVMQAALLADAGETTETIVAAPKTEAKPGEKKPEGEAKPGEAKPGEKKTDAKSGDKKPEGEDSEFTKAKKDAERRDKSWKALDQEKAAFRAERESLTATVQGLQRELAELKQQGARGPAKPKADEHGATAEDYERLAKKYAADGDDKMAELATKRAEKMRAADEQAGSGAAKGGAADVNSPEFQKEWQRHTDELIAGDAELAKPDNPLVKSTQALLHDRTFGRFFRAHPDGIKAALEVAKLMKSAHESAEMSKAFEAEKTAHAATKKENERLTALLQPRGGGGGRPPAGERKLEEMKPDEADAEIRRIAAAADRGEV